MEANAPEVKEEPNTKKLVQNSIPKESPNPTNFSNLRSQNYLSHEKENTSAMSNLER